MASLKEERLERLQRHMSFDDLDMLLEAARTCGWDCDHTAVMQFVDWCYTEVLGIAPPLEREPYAGPDPTPPQDEP
jgi:hypothetical protein